VFAIHRIRVVLLGKFMIWPTGSTLRFSRFLVLLFAVPLMLFWGKAYRSPALAESAPTGGKSFSPEAQRHEWQGVASCASTACHGGNGPTGSKGSEYTTWILQDKHTQAYQVLFDIRSQLIEKNLRHKKSLKDAHAEKDQLCLRCHAMNADDEPQREIFVRDFGIGCESCHGAAQEWLGVHYRRDWSAKNDVEKRELGFRPLQALGERATLCVTCHVGTADKAVNHDLIAAGHPRLNFEFGAFQAITPKHWREEGENARPDFEARAWALGQLVSARAALALLESRARTAAAPWPEFAEHDCFACHHDLREPSWRQKPGHYAKRTPGVLPWGAWYYTLLPQALRLSAGKNEPIGKVLGELDDEMDKASPSRERVAEDSRRAIRELDRYVTGADKRHYEQAALQALFNGLRGRDPEVTVTRWDDAAQVYLALAALYNALGDMDHGQRDPALRESLKARAKRLQFPKGYDSPRGFDPRLSGELRDPSPR
jgi:hypothetical protein